MPDSFAWCVSQVPYLPQLCFPFIVVFDKDQLAAFETVMTVFMYWGHSYCATFPSPPIHLLHVLDELLRLHDKTVHEHMREALHIQSVGAVLWQLLSTLFTEVVGRLDWLALMDFLILHYERAELALLTSVAVVKTLRVSILAMDRGEALFALIRYHAGDMPHAPRVTGAVIQRQAAIRSPDGTSSHNP